VLDIFKLSICIFYTNVVKIVVNCSG
jgi:hypothetical protein